MSNTDNTAKGDGIVTVNGKDVDVSGITRPEALAAVLGMSAKVLRAHLRATYPRPVEVKGTTWTLDSDVAIAVAKHFVARRTVMPEQPTA